MTEERLETSTSDTDTSVTENSDLKDEVDSTKSKTDQKKVPFLSGFSKRVLRVHKGKILPAVTESSRPGWVHSAKHAPLKKTSQTLTQRWVEMAEAEMTPELQREINAVMMRDSADPTRHYAKLDWDGKNLPTRIQVGRVVGSAEDHFGRLTNRERAGTMLDELVRTSTKSGEWVQRKAGEIAERKGRRTKRRKKMSKKMRNPTKVGFD
eukprot:gnl/Dysnectes_brevis/3698_a4731_737.p1 GENE.gnl/Dysnectes_brevis/3698_a4731_737~~gnl/Dysnectes_brevis/3698_a4731_737.p1  ORF type:complete len:209 (-),score=46.70 gnl/Dysnectes_brevis/3698_a4731_737:61-687(-)